MRIVLDIGANIGAATLYFAATFPDAAIHAFEPSSRAYELLKKNTKPVSNVRLHNHGLFSSEKKLRLFHGKIDSATASVGKSNLNAEESEVIELRSTRAWLENASISKIDVLKLDTEEMAGAWYVVEQAGQTARGWLCPALRRYFGDPPAEIHISVEERRE